MGSYCYTVRKKHQGALLEGIIPIDVIPYEYAYKLSLAQKGDPWYGSVVRRESLYCNRAEVARGHHLTRAREIQGTQPPKLHFALGGIDDGAPVYESIGWLPSGFVDDIGISRDEVKLVGKLYKIGRGDWVVSNTCPKHRWQEYTEARDGTLVYQCERCDALKDERFNGIKYQP